MTAGKPNVKMTFRVTPGSRLRKADAEVLGQTFENLKSTGPLTAERVLQEASRSNSALHRFFQWDDQKAAHQYRLTQARQLLRSIEVVIEDAKGKKVPMKAYYNVRDADGQREYASMEFVFDTPDLADQVIESATSQLEAWKTRYAKYTWAKGAIPAIARALAMIRATTTKAKKAKKAA